MKKLLTVLMLLSMLLASCMKEKPITIDHPVSVDVEPNANYLAYYTQFIDLTDSKAESVTELKGQLEQTSPDIALFIVPNDYMEQDIELVFRQLASDLSYHEFNAISHNGVWSIVIADKQGRQLPSLGVKTFEFGNERYIQYIPMGSKMVVLAQLTTEEEKDMVLETYTIQPEFYWIYTVRLEGESDTFTKAAFTDCYRAQWGEEYLWEARNNFIYTSPGAWNYISNLQIIRPAAIQIPEYLFTLNVEEDAL